LLGIRAAVSLRKKMDLSAVGPVLLRLPEHAGLEAWWVTAEVAAATGSEAVWSIAETQAGQLAGNAGHLGDAFRRYARARFASLGH